MALPFRRRVSSTCATLAAALLFEVACSAAAAQTATTPAAPPVSRPASDASPIAAPRVHLIATGGTISNRQGSRLTADDLIRLIPNLDQYARVDAEQFLNVASTQLTLDNWVALSRRINELFRHDKDLSGIVVTSGTDTLEETAYFLHLTIASDRPVVVVGSMRRPDVLGYEGAANLLAAFRVAGDPASRGKGVLVVLNDEINSARDVTKTDALRLDTFRSPTGRLGVVDADRISYYREPLRRHTSRSEFGGRDPGRLPRVDILMTYQDAPGDLIRAAVDRGARGLVVAGAGAGAMSGTQSEGMHYALEKGVFVVVGSRTGSGRVAAEEPPQGMADADARRRARFQIAAEDLTPLKARILLMLALTRTSDRAAIQRMFQEYLNTTVSPRPMVDAPRAWDSCSTRFRQVAELS